MLEKKNKPNLIDELVGKKLKERRLYIGMSQEVLGNVSGVTFQQIQKYEKGQNRIGASRLYKIASALDVPISFFFNDIKGLDESNNGSAIYIAEAGEPFTHENTIPSKEINTLVKLYSKIKDKAVRKNIISIINNLSEED
jgi:transcriptional regulator with XRE-family HTH domain